MAGLTRWILAAIAIALFCVQIDYFAVNLALPRMASELHSSTTDMQWVVSIYMLTLGAFMVPAGRIADIFGRRRVLLSGIALFAVASVLCAVAPTPAAIVGFRALQGIGAAMIFPVSVSVLTNAYPAVSASRAIGTAYGIAGLGNAAGPLVGGVLTETVAWRAVFWLLVPFTLISLVIGARVIPESFDETAPRRIDVSGLALITVGIGLFTLAFDRAPTWGWLSPATIGAGIAAVVLLTAFVAVERRTRHPLVDLGLFGNPGFAVLVVAGTVANIAYVVTVFLTTLNLQQVRGLDPLMAGVVFLGPSAGAALGGTLSGRLPSASSPVRVMAAGCIAAAISLAALTVSGGWVGYAIALTACGFTMGFVYAFTTVATQAVVPPARAGEAAGVTLTALVTLAGVGVAVSGTVLEVLQLSGMGTGAGIDAILTAIALALSAAGLAVWIRARRSPVG
ncbi:MFS transporter [Mycolicibacterium septicum DSM 44393]|uniref:MFS transporter n=1 Tax=Mycolicibacterium septicum DSM 44393 TaxID=1341646 RepID=A0A7X6MQX7_9MYCO|nr:MFS transporter [Mycolicibacterium septicum]NKZ12881.1 MFS transporter [Mycolicibacterium septicum DSM 44393]